MLPGLNKGRNQIISGAHGILVESHCDSMMLTRALVKHLVTRGTYYFTIFLTQAIS
jgi:hypothetical protein